MLRALGSFEKAALISNDYAPFNVTIVIRMQNAPSPETVRLSLNKIKQTHPLLRSKITELNKLPWFQEDSDAPQIPLEVLDLKSSPSWIAIAEQEMAFSIPKSKAPLARSKYLYSGPHGDLILTLHHSIIDGSAGIYLIDQLLKYMSDTQYEIHELPLPLIRNDNLPLSHHGFRKFMNLSRFGLSQMAGEISYQIKNLGKRIPKVCHGGTGKVIPITLTQELTEKISRKGRLERITINSILNAAQLLAVNKILYASQSAAMQTFSFADLRPYLTPPIPPESLGGWVTLFRVLTNVNGNMDFWDLASALHRKITTSLKKGDKYNAFLTSGSLLKMMTKLNAFRFGSSAINYSGVIPIQPAYGLIKVDAIHGLVSAYDLAPEFSSQARIFNDQLIWDFIYLSTDMDGNTALKLVQEIKSILENAVSDL